MKKLSLLLFSVVTCALLAACSHTVPSAGAIYIAPKSETVEAGAIGNLLGKHLTLKVTKATKDLAEFKAKSLLVSFSLGNSYQLYRLTAGNKWSMSHGAFSYSLDAYNVKSSRLLMLGKNGLNIKLNFKTITTGSFDARSNNPDVSGSIQGSFTLALN